MSPPLPSRVSRWRGSGWLMRAPGYRMSLVLQNAISPFFHRSHQPPNVRAIFIRNRNRYHANIFPIFSGLFPAPPCCVLDTGQKEHVLFKLERINQVGKGNFKHKLGGSSNKSRHDSRGWAGRVEWSDETRGWRGQSRWMMDLESDLCPGCRALVWAVIERCLSLWWRWQRQSDDWNADFFRLFFFVSLISGLHIKMKL